MQKWQSNILLWPRSHDLMTHCDTGVFYKDPSVTWANEEKDFRGKKKRWSYEGRGGHSPGWSLITVVSPGWSLIRVIYHLGGLSSGWSLVVFPSGWSMTWVVFHQGGL